MSFEWSEKLKKFTMFATDDKEDIIEKFDPKMKKSKKVGNVLSGGFEKDEKKEEMVDCKSIKQ